jgi:hypothetical protein
MSSYIDLKFINDVSGRRLIIYSISDVPIVVIQRNQKQKQEHTFIE